MILLDTNVISESLKQAPNARVIEWIDAQLLETLYLSTITVAELRTGIALLPIGKRRTLLHENLEKQILPLFMERILTFDFSCTQLYAELMAKARVKGVAISAADGYIAGIAATHRLTVATRDIVPFQAVGVPIINPFVF